MKTIWDWVGSPSYWMSAAALQIGSLTVTVFLQTKSYSLAVSVALGFCFCWMFSAKATKAAIRARGNT